MNYGRGDAAGVGERTRGGKEKINRGRRKKCEGRKELSDNAEGLAEL